MREEATRPYTLSEDIVDIQPVSAYSKPHRRKGSSLFAAFMAGALLVGGLMYTADKLNLFSGGGSGQAASASGIQTASNRSSAGTGDISGIAEQASPAVVKIETKVAAGRSSAGARNGSPFFDPFAQDSSGSAAPRDGGGELQTNGTGSGFIFQESGYILTNEHVISGADQVDVYVQGYDQPFQAKVLGSSEELDLAVLKIEGDGDFPALSLGDSDQSRIGDWVVAIGNPLDFDYTVTTGVISAKERPITIADDEGTRQYEHLLQTDTAINPGNSGGPLLNLNGEVIGINTAVNAEAQGIGFAIPASTVSSVLDNLMQGKDAVQS